MDAQQLLRGSKSWSWSRVVKMQHSSNPQLLLFVAANSLGFPSSFWFWCKSEPAFVVWQDLQRRFFWERQEMKTLKQRKCWKHNNAVLTVFKISFSSPFLCEHIVTNITDVGWSLGLRACRLFFSELRGSGGVAEPGKKAKITRACHLGMKVSYESTLCPSWCFSRAAWFLVTRRESLIPKY